MHPRSLLLAAAALVLAAVGGLAAARTLQEGGEAPQPVQPGEMHRWLATHHGTWDCKVEGPMGPSQATWVSEAGPGGLWNVGAFRGDMMGLPFEGRELLGYDPASERFTSVWVDSWSTVPMILEGEYDASAGRMVMRGEVPGPDGTLVTAKHVTTYPDQDTMVFRMHGPGPDGPESELMKITYTRRK